MFDFFKKRRAAKARTREADDMLAMLRELDEHLANVGCLHRVMDGPRRERDQFMQLAMPAISAAQVSAALDRELGYRGDTGELVKRVASVLYVNASVSAMKAAGYRPQPGDLVWMQMTLAAAEKGEMTPSLANFLPKAREALALAIG